MLTTHTLTIDPRLPVSRTALTAFRASQLERQIDHARMTASLESDWDQLHTRSRELGDQISEHTSALQQIEAIHHIRRILRRKNDNVGLRALRLAAAGRIMGWLRHETTRPGARQLGRLFETDQRSGIPGLAELETRLQAVQSNDLDRLTS